jgi:uncharacterized coiled-coil protein SlyX
MTQENFDYKEIIERHQEKIRHLIKKTKDLEEQNKEIETSLKILENKNIDKLSDNMHELEIRIKSVEIAQGGHDEKWKSIINFIVQIIWVTMAAYILFKLGLQTPI